MLTSVWKTGSHFLHWHWRRGAQWSHRSGLPLLLWALSPSLRLSQPHFKEGLTGAMGRGRPQDVCPPSRAPWQPLSREPLGPPPHCEVRHCASSRGGWDLGASLSALSPGLGSCGRQDMGQIGCPGLGNGYLCTRQEGLREPDLSETGPAV